MAKKLIVYEAIWVVSIVLASVLLWHVKQAPPVSTGPGVIVTYSTKDPSEQKPHKKSYQWQGRPEDPKYIKLPTIHAEGFIQKMGVDQHNAIAAPPNIHFAGWFVESAMPGQPGLSIIDGHVDGWTERGIFHGLTQLKSGDAFTVELGNGTVHMFRVKQVTSVDQNAAGTLLFAQDPDIASQLNLITCTGPFDRTASRYLQRVIVTSSLVNSTRPFDSD